MPSVVYVCVAEYDGIELLRVERQRRPIAVTQCFVSLEHAAIQHYLTARVSDQVFRAGDCSGGA